MHACSCLVGAPHRLALCGGSYDDTTHVASRLTCDKCSVRLDELLSEGRIQTWASPIRKNGALVPLYSVFPKPGLLNVGGSADLIGPIRHALGYTWETFTPLDQRFLVMWHGVSYEDRLATLRRRVGLSMSSGARGLAVTLREISTFMSTYEGPAGPLHFFRFLPYPGDCLYGF